LTDADGLVARARSACPGLAFATARLVDGEGQNSAVLIADDRLVFRFPRYAAGRAALAGEIALLRRLRGRLPLPVPDPLCVAEDFVAYRLIPGEPLRQATLDGIGDAGTLRKLGEQVGEFARALHAVPVEAAGFDPLAQWRALYGRIEARLFGHMRPGARAATARHFERFLGSGVADEIEPALVHGDFGTGNILYDPAARRIAGVIDFGHAGLGDPAVDYAALPWSPGPFLEGAAAAYPAVRRADDRVAFYRGTFALQEALFGVESGDEAAFRAGIAPYV
jgi:aminoglycoside 2''-phosphotransferase